MSKRHSTSGSGVRSGFTVDSIVRSIGRLVHRSVRAVVSKAYHWNNAADRR